jgi:hypothetical protein
MEELNTSSGTGMSTSRRVSHGLMGYFMLIFICQVRDPACVSNGENCPGRVVGVAGHTSGWTDYQP